MRRQVACATEPHTQNKKFHKIATTILPPASVKSSMQRLNPALGACSPSEQSWHYLQAIALSGIPWQYSVAPGSCKRWQGACAEPCKPRQLHVTPSGAEAPKEPAGAGCQGTGPPGAPRPSPSDSRACRSQASPPQRSTLGLCFGTRRQQTQSTGPWAREHGPTALSASSGLS